MHSQVCGTVSVAVPAFLAAPEGRDPREYPSHGVAVLTGSLAVQPGGKGEFSTVWVETREGQLWFMSEHGGESSYVRC